MMEPRFVLHHPSDRLSIPARRAMTLTTRPEIRGVVVAEFWRSGAGWAAVCLVDGTRYKAKTISELRDRVESHLSNALRFIARALPSRGAA